jgi:putative aldouronate transport system permease protein
MRKIIKKSPGDVTFDVMIYFILILASVITIVPFLEVITISFSPQEVISSYGLHLFPTKVTLEGYQKVFGYDLVWSSYLNTIIRTGLGTILSMVLYVMGAYPLSRKYLPHKTFWTALFLITLYFQGGLIPTYILVANWLHLKDTVWALILPNACSAFTLLIVRNFFMTLPEELQESAKIDGANDIYILYKIIVPLSKPILATVALWSLVFHWNDWMYCMFYISSQSKFVLQYVLRLILIDGQVQDMSLTTSNYVNNDALKMAALVVSTVPIVCTYPFLQKYFVKGVMIGAVKG